MQPYQKESNAIRESGRTGADILKYAGSAAIGGGLASVASKSAQQLLTKIGSWLSPYIPEDMFLKGISKVDKRIGNFVSQAMENGADISEVRDFIGEKISKGQQGNKNIIQKYSPELHEFIDEQVKRGRSALQAGAAAQGMSKFSNVIKKLTKDHKVPWSNILESVYGGETAQSEQQQPQQTQQMASQMQQPAQQTQQGQPGPGNQALMAILQKIQQAKGGVQ